MFCGMTRKGKKEGCGETKLMPAFEQDFAQLSDYFKEKMTGPLNAVYYSTLWFST